ncbi:MAG: WD40-repeat-containing domain protein [Olpidium bornovanus]|uniref:WD40-repeat-containing domain protein n=1 Tax=Olpidium bornovanus TaxID=278681 RepID=A0A8H8A2A6_9FUNG|nr:MAG: WD40-repeat-containing domain protein [Olpidium bornovanus]
MDAAAAPGAAAAARNKRKHGASAGAAAEPAVSFAAGKALRSTAPVAGGPPAPPEAREAERTAAARGAAATTQPGTAAREKPRRATADIDVAQLERLVFGTGSSSDSESEAEETPERRDGGTVETDAADVPRASNGEVKTGPRGIVCDGNDEESEPDSEGEVETAAPETGEPEISSGEERQSPKIADSIYGRKQPAWCDEDDDTFAVDVTAKARSRKLRKTEAETTLTGREYEQRLRAQYCRMNNPHVAFRQVRKDPPEADILITGRRKYFYTYDLQAGRVQRVSCIRGRENDKTLERFSISPAGDLVAFQGSGGYVSLVSTKTWQWVGGVQLNGGVKSVAWKPDGHGLYGVAADSQIYLWDVRNYSCTRTFPDHGGFKSNYLATSGDSKYLAVGGFVNVYDASRFDLSPASDDLATTFAPQPLKSLGNLTTTITQLKFNHDSQILGMASKLKKDKLRLVGRPSFVWPALFVAGRTGRRFITLFVMEASFTLYYSSREIQVHLPSLTVFQNWPTFQTPLSYVQCFDFSPRSGYIAVGNDKGKVLLYRLLQYRSA